MSVTPRCVIAISGYPGSGKTRLARQVSRRSKITHIEYDRYERFTQKSPAEIQSWLARGAPYEEISTPGMREAIREARGVVVLDTPLGRAQPGIGPLVDKLIWIDCPPDLALARKVAQLARNVPKNQGDGFARWLDGYMQAYETIVRPACAVQARRVAPDADLRLDASLSPAVQDETVLAFLSDCFG